jgi:SAM-dependent methyltransferase
MNCVVKREHDRQVSEYYDLNTGRFLRWGKDEGTRNIHAALWPPEVDSLAAAMNHSDELVARAIDDCPYPVHRVLDLGCGVGGSVFYLGRRLPRVRSFQGVSLSPVQVERARARVPADQRDRFRFEEGSFLELAAERFAADFSFAIEAFAHGADPGRFFMVQARVLPRGGRLVIIDDCLEEGAGTEAPPARPTRLLETYRRNWLLPGLRHLDALRSIAREEGFHLISHQNLTPYLRIGRPRDRAIALLVRLLGRRMERTAYFRALAGGDAKQQCYREGLLRYLFLIFENQSAESGR